MRISVVIPIYNELRWIGSALSRLESVPTPQHTSREIVIVDDCSTDGTRAWLEQLEKDRTDITLLYHQCNQGKGAALRTGFRAATGDIILVHDADLEYDPADHLLLLRPILDGRADVVFGTRFLGGTHRVLYYWHAVGNWLLTTLSNMLSNVNLSDMECCLKAFRREVIEKIDLREDRFGFEPEITAKVARLRCRIYEVPVNYAGRTYEEGKKITWRDGASAIRCILKYNLL
jgi:glycosyltransferase involved in cell wall biosynthesis